MTHKGKKLGIIVQILKDYDILFDDIDDLFPNEMLDTISVSKWR